MGAKVFSMVSTRDSLRYTMYALQSFFKYTPLSSGDLVVVIDNDGSLNEELLDAYRPWIKLISHRVPKSFAENCNIGMRQARESEADLFVLNNDLAFTPGWLAALEIEEACLVFPACNMQFAYSLQGLSCGLQMSLDDLLGKEEILHAIAKGHCSRQGGYKIYHSIPYYCVRIPRKVYSEVGEFCEEYRPYGWEDIDYSLRCILKGYCLKFALGSFIIHFYGKSTWAKDKVEAGHEMEKCSDSPGACQIFERKWGRDLAKIFGYQDGESLAKVRKAEEQAIIRGYTEMVERLRPH